MNSLNQTCARPHIALAAAFATFAIVATGCAKDPSKDVAKAKVAEAGKEAAAPKGEKAADKPTADKGAAKPAEGTAKADKAAPAAAGGGAGIALSGQIDFIGSKVTGNHECTFKDWSGTFTLKDGKVDGGALKFAVKTASAVADYKDPSPWSKKLEAHFRSCDFFCVEKHPEATFVSKSIAAKPGDKGATHEVTGDLTIRGTTKSITFPATIAASDKEVTGKVEFSINRKDFGIQYAGKPDDLIRDDVVLKIDVKGARS